MIHEHTLTDKEQEFARRMSALLLDLVPTDVPDKVTLNPSLQGWNSKSLKAASNLNIREDIELPASGSPQVDNLASCGVLLLGYYRATPREIVLFPEAMRLVVELDAYQKADISYELLFRSVLLHEVGHWITLHPRNHKARIGRCVSPPNDEAESLTETLNWISLVLAAREGVSGSLELLRCQYFKRSRGPVWQYQIYPFWLAASGLVSCKQQLSAAPLLEPNSKTLDWFRNWFAGNEELPFGHGRQANTLDAMRDGIFTRSEKIREFLPFFDSYSPEIENRIAQLFEKWDEEWKILPLVPDRDLHAIVDI